nr:hypothetical protein [Tanacetum cinerariifolium]
TTSDGSAKKKGQTVTVTTEDMQKRKNDVKARTTLLLSLPDEHQLRFSKYKTAQELWVAILKTFGGNEATKKAKKNLLKQQYGNFKAEGIETLEQTFNRLQVIVSQLEFTDIEIKQDDLDQKSTSLKCRRNQSRIPRIWLLFLQQNTAVEMRVNTASVSPVSTNVSPASVNIRAASISQDTACAYIASQSSGSQIKFEDTDMEEMDIKWNMALLSMRADRERRAPRSQDRGRRDNYRQWSKVEEQTPKALMAIDGVEWDWSYMVNEEENHAFVAEEELLQNFPWWPKLVLKVSKNMLFHYKAGLSQVEGRLAEFKNQEIKFCKKIRGLEIQLEFKINRIESLTNELEPTPTVESKSNDLQNKNPYVTVTEPLTSTILSKPDIKFVKAIDRTTETKTAKVEIAKLLLNMLQCIANHQRNLLLGGTKETRTI